jgi:hypothetical protein
MRAAALAFLIISTETITVDEEMKLYSEFRLAASCSEELVREKLVSNGREVINRGVSASRVFIYT